MVDCTNPSCHIRFCRRLQQIMSPIFSIELEYVRAVVMHRMRDPGVNNAKNQRRLARGSKVQLSRSTFGCADVDMVQCKSVRYRTHQLLEESRRSTFL